MKKLSTRNKELTSRMKQVVQFVFEHPGMTQLQIGQALGISDQRVSQILRCDRVLAAYPFLARSRMKSLIPAAVRAQEEVINQSRDLNVKDRASARLLESQGIMERAAAVQVNVYAQMPLKDLAEHVCNNIKKPDDIIEGEIVNDSDDSTTA